MKNPLINLFCPVSIDFDIRAEELTSLKANKTSGIIELERTERQLILDIISELNCESESGKYLKMTLVKYLVGVSPFPNLDDYHKIEVGRPQAEYIPTWNNSGIKLPPDPEQVLYYTLKTTKNKAHKLLGIPRKSLVKIIDSNPHQYENDEQFFKSCTHWEKHLQSDLSKFNANKK